MQRNNSDGRERSLANLEPYKFKKGQSGNPSGRPRSAILSDALRCKLAEVDPIDESGRTYAEVIAEQIIIRAKAGDVQAIKEIADRVEGKARQTLSVTNDRRGQLEAMIESMITDAADVGEELTRDRAIMLLSPAVPELQLLT